MSWPTRTPNQTRRQAAATAVVVGRINTGRVAVILSALMMLAEIVGLSNVACGQENPLREGAWDAPSGSPVESGNEAGYLEQLLPSLQKLQAEAPSAPSSQPNPDGFPEGLAGRALSGTEAGVWSAEPNPGGSLSQPAAALVEGQTETRLADSHATFPAWNGWETAEPASGSASTTLKAPASPGSGLTRSGKSGADSASSRLKAFQGVESLQLDSTMVKVGLNTLLVLAATVGLILVARKTLPRQPLAQPKPVGRLRIEQSLSLGGKAELKVVRCGLNQVLVAIDAGGIRSVVALEPALETEREHLEPAAPSPLAVASKDTVNKEPVNIEQFVKMIKDMEGDFMAARTGR